MKPPLAPEPFSKLLIEHHKSFSEILQSCNSPTVSGRYLHWDEIRQRPPPAELTHEHWWLGIKLARNSQQHELPYVKGSDGRPFFFLLPDRVVEGLHRIDRQMAGTIGVPESTGKPAVPDRFIVNSLIQEAITSSKLEGASTTRAEAVDMLRSGRRPRDRSERMIVNNYRAMQIVRELTGQPLSPDGVLHLHKTITAGTLDDPVDAGRIQEPGEKRVYVSDPTGRRVLHHPPPAKELDKRIHQMLRLANREDTDKKFIHPVIRAIALHFLLAYDHPFVDGNGRTARALFYWSMLQSGYWLFEFISISRYLVEAPSRYARSFLYTESDDNDLTYFISLQVELILRAIEDLERYIAKKTAQIEAVENMLRRAPGFNHRQLSLLAHGLRTPNARYTIRSHQTSHSVANGTARSDLLNLVERGLLERRPSDGRRFEFLVPPDLEQRIRTLRR